MSRVRRKPTEAFAWRVEELCRLAAGGWSELPDAVRKAYADNVIQMFLKDGIQVVTDTDEVVLAPKGHWLILNAQGEWYPCSPEAFEAGYEPADAVTTVEVWPRMEEEDRDRVEVVFPGEGPMVLTEEAAHAVLDQLCEHFGLEVVTAPRDARLPDDVLDELDDEDMTIERAVEIIHGHEARSDQSPSIRVMVNSEDVAALVRKLGGGEIRHEGTDESRGVGPSEMEVMVDEPEVGVRSRLEWAAGQIRALKPELRSLRHRVRVLEKRGDGLIPNEPVDPRNEDGTIRQAPA